MNHLPKNTPKQHICVGLLAHVDAGKTTLSEAMLYETGQLKQLGRVDHQDAFLDTYSLERARGITIFSKQARLQTGTLSMTLLDTPGHVDFSTETERTLQVLDYAILIISGTDGVQAHTETLWQLLRRYHIPTFLFLNKMDLAGANTAGLMGELKLPYAAKKPWKLISARDSSLKRNWLLKLPGNGCSPASPAPL